MESTIAHAPIATAPRSNEPMIAVGFYICIYAAGAMAVKFFKLQESRVGIYRAMLLFGNIGFIGLPMISSVFPENGILYASVFMLIDQKQACQNVNNE